ncbi:DUF4105 domain-containing protein [Marinobacter sp. NFXS11]|uniref:lipoprotein N-acyltransferase Lnb domain-containing protein n=1 Tax=Marinobacter sp. NFXS11 TaxID=2818432 RepID=UPI0032DFD0AF
MTGKQGSDADFLIELSKYRTAPSYKCRHPAYAFYFSQRLGESLDYSECPSSVPFYLLDREKGGYQVSIAPNLVRSIHIMFASPGESVASQFGHLSIRLIVCPFRSASDDECNENIFDHVVLGYGARINELEMSLMKGVFGGYDAHLTGFSFMEAYRTNTLLADRNLFSIPLNLSPEETEQVVRELSEIHWSFRGDYRFFTNNCATLLQDTLAGLLEQAPTEPPVAGNLETGYLRPDSFFQALRRSELADDRVLASLKEAEREGYYFPSTRPYYERAFELVSQTAGWDAPSSLDEYLRTPAKKRLLIALKSDALLDVYSHDQRAREAHTLLEERALISLEQARLQSLMSLLADPEIMASLQNGLNAMEHDIHRRWLEQCVLQPVLKLQGRLPVSKGIPGPEFMRLFPSVGTDCDQTESLVVAKRLVNDWLPEDHLSVRALRSFSLEIEQTHENLVYLRTL